MKFGKFTKYKTFKGFWNAWYTGDNELLGSNHPESDVKFVWKMKEERIKQLEREKLILRTAIQEVINEENTRVLNYYGDQLEEALREAGE